MSGINSSEVELGYGEFVELQFNYQTGIILFIVTVSEDFAVFFANVQSLFGNCTRLLFNPEFYESLVGSNALFNVVLL